MHKSKPTSAPSLLDTEPTHEAPGMLLRLDTENNRQPKKIAKPNKPKRRLAWRWGLGVLAIAAMVLEISLQNPQSPGLPKVMPSHSPATMDMATAKPQPEAEPLPAQVANIINEPSNPAEAVTTKDVTMLHPVILLRSNSDVDPAKTPPPAKVMKPAPAANVLTPNKPEPGSLEPMPSVKTSPHEADVGLVAAMLASPEDTIGTEPSLLAGLLASAKRAVVPKKIAQLVSLPDQEDSSSPASSQHQNSSSRHPTR